MLRLGEVVSRLVQDAASGIRAAETEAELKRQEIAEMLEKPEEELVSDEEVDEFLRTHFPDPKVPGETAIRAGAAYVSPEFLKLRVDVEEFPPISKVLGIKLSRGELAPGRVVVGKRALPVLTPEAVARIRREVRKKLGQKRKKALRSMLTTGMPVPQVETVSIELRAGFERDLRINIPRIYEADRIQPEAVGKLRIKMRLER